MYCQRRCRLFFKHLFHGGIHPEEHKDTATQEIVEFRDVTLVFIPMFMHIGTPCAPTVKRGEQVYRGQLIGEPSGISAPIHSSISGTVKSVKERLLGTNSVVQVVEIESDGEFTELEGLTPPSYSDRESFLECVRASGLVGLGGAGFPTWQKFNETKEGVKIDTLLINGMECEPFITSDHRQMLEEAPRIIKGVNRLIAALDIDRAIIGVENNKPDAIAALKEALKDSKLDNAGRIEVRAFPARYPQGAAKTFVVAATKRIVPAQARVTDVGVQVMNVATVCQLERYFETGMPLVDKVVTLTGDCPKGKGNYRVPIGTMIDEFVEHTGGFAKEPSVVSMGGPLNGMVIYDLHTPLIKNNNAITCLSEEFMDEQIETNCIRCGRCVEACPQNLMPLVLDKAARQKDFATLDSHAIMNCIECASCAYVCPAKRHLLQSIKMGKAYYRTKKRKIEANR